MPNDAFFVIAQHRGIVADIEHRQLLYISLCIVFQLLILIFMNYSSYQPYAQLMKALSVGPCAWSRIHPWIN